MKKKAIIVIICIVLFGICFTISYIAMNGKIKSKNEKDNINSDITGNEANSEDILDENGEEKYQKVMPRSRIGIEVLKHFEVSNIYSSKFYELLDNEGLTDKVKRTWAFINIMQGKNYVYMLEYSSEGAHTLISEQNMKTAVSEIFYDSKDVSNGDLIYDFKYDSDKKYYTIPSIGFSNEDNKIVIEVPAEIREYKDRYEVYMYRLYLKQHMQEAVDVYSDVKMLTDVYYDSNLKQKAYEIDDIAMYGELSSQIDLLSSYLENNKIDSHIALKVKYTLVKEGESYKISKYDK